MKKLLKTFAAIVTLSALLSSVLLTHATPVDTVFDEFFKENSEVIKEFTDAMGVDNYRLLESGKVVTLGDDGNPLADVDMKGFDVSTYMEKRTVAQSIYIIYGDMFSLSKEQIAENVKNFDFSSFIKEMPVAQIVTTRPDEDGKYRSAGRGIAEEDFTYVSQIPASSMPLSYDKLEEIIKSEIGNVDIGFFTFAGVGPGNLALYFESDKGNYFIPAATGAFSTTQKGKLYTQHEYLVAVLDEVYKDEPYDPWEGMEVRPPESMDPNGGGAGGVPLSGEQGESTPLSQTNATLITIGIALTTLGIMLFVSKVRSKISKK